MAQGIANVVVPFFGGIPATGTIARTVTNVRAGATSPVAGIVHAAVLLAIVLVAAPLAVHVPLAVLAGILLFVAFNMGEWHEFARLRRFSVEYRTKLIATFLLTVMVDLTVAMEVGLVLACGFFVYRMGTLFRVEIDDAGLSGVRICRLYGSLFFGAVGKLEAVAEGLPPRTRAVVLEMHQLVSMDTSGLEALKQLHRALERRDVRMVLCALNEQPRSMLRQSQFDSLLGAASICPDLPSALEAVGAAPAQARPGTESAEAPPRTAEG